MNDMTLPQIRSDEHLFSVPKFDINKEDIEGFDNELKGFHQNFRDCFTSVVSIVKRIAITCPILLGIGRFKIINATI